ncbi:MAG: DUF4239 domain-containing protein [Alphaproteobacteria bacterium]|nr:DUF4239 domain-containing protein [Alphaproteobacteria bacterium]
MQRYLINHLSAGEFIALLMCSILCLALTLSFLSNKYLTSFMSYDNNRFTGYFLGSISASYGFILGFIIVTLWRELYEVKIFIMHEAEYLSLLVYNSSAFPISTQSELNNGIEQYIKVIIQDEWPLMHLGKVSEKTVPALLNLFHLIQSYSPETRIEETFYNQFINNLNRVVEFRRKRLEYLDSSLIDVIRFMLGFGLIIILFLISLLDSDSKKLKILSIILVSGMLSFNLGLAFLLDYPLAGSIL